MSRFGGLSEERPSVFKTRSKLSTHLRPNVAGMKGRVDLAQPVNRNPDLWCGSTTRSYSSNTQRGKEFRERKKKRKTSIKSNRKRDIKQKNSANSSSATAKSRSEYMREYRRRKKTLQNTLLMPSLMTNDGNAIETLLMTAQINTDLANPPVPSTTELPTGLVRVETDSYESIINSILPYKDYDSHKNAHKDFQKRFVDNPFDHGCSICDRLRFRDDLRMSIAEHKTILQNILPGINLKDIKACYNSR
ncbi:uncharacterized protein TNCV_4089521 [Trichonephila clavipes]|nr:uncharacterized protein TNCV_4089521 [Trichonephila clavipes]